MNITLTNLEAIPVPFCSSQGKGFAITLQPNTPEPFISTEVTVASVGDNPAFRDALGDVAKNMLHFLVGMLTVWRDKQTAPPPHPVRVLIDNRGPKSLSVLQGSTTNVWQLAPGQSYTAQAGGYVEIRELEG